MRKRFCDVCGAEIPDTLAVDQNEATKMFDGVFHYGAVVAEEYDELYAVCGGKVRDFIRELKRKAVK